MISDDAVRTIETIVAEIDKKLSEQINLIMHHQDFQRLEGTWRGLSHLINNTETDEQLKIRVLNLSKKDLGKTLKKFKGTAWDQSPYVQKDVRGRISVHRAANPMVVSIGDYTFDHTPKNVEMSKVALPRLPRRHMRHLFLPPIRD